MKKYFSKKGPCLLIFIGLLTPLSTLAQTGIRTTTESEGDRFLREESLREDIQLLEDDAELITESPKEVEPALEDTLCFEISSITLSGVNSLAISILREIVDPYEGQCLGQNKITAIINLINQTYINKGYITTRAYTPPQNLSEGELLIEVQEGLIEFLQINQGQGVDKRKKWSAFPQAAVGDVLNIRNLEQGIDQINSVSSANGTVKLWPGELVGTTRVEVINTTADELRFSIGRDNQGTQSTGKNRTRLGVAKDNLLGFNDSLSINYIGSQDTNALVLQYRIPFRRFSVSYTRSYSEYLNVLTEFSELFGNTDTESFSLDYALFRNNKHQLSLNTSLSLRDSERYINDVFLTPQSLTVARFGFNHRYIADKSRWLFNVSYAQGLDNFDALNDSPDIDKDAPHAQFKKIEANIYYSRAFGNNYYFRSLLSGQFADHSLYGSEQIHLGDLSTVRGFILQPFSGDHGFYLRNDLILLGISRWLNNYFFLGEAQLSTFIDFGVADSIARNFYGNHSESLAGGGVSLSFYSRFVTFSTTLAKPIYTSQSTLEKDSQFYFSINATF